MNNWGGNKTRILSRAHTHTHPDTKLPDGVPVHLCPLSKFHTEDGTHRAGSGYLHSSSMGFLCKYSYYIVRLVTNSLCNPG